MAHYHLVVVEGKDAGRIVPLEGSSVTLGRPGSGVAEGAVEFEEPSVSRVHAVLNLVEDSWELSNRSFTNPARVDGEPATARIRLREGSRIQLGALVAEVRSGGSADAPDTPLMGFLEVLQGNRPGARFPVYWRRSLIGRSSACEVRLEETAVSRHHAVVEWYDRVPVLMNMSANSTTTVNGQAIPKGASLGPRDWMLLGGEVVLRWLPVEILAEEEEERRRAEAAAPPPPTVAPAPSSRRPGGVPLALRVRDLCLGAPLEGRARFFSDLSQRLDRGESISSAVAEAAAALPRLAPHLSQAVGSGGSLTEALARFPGSFDPYEDSMVGAGEEAGTLEAQLHVLARSHEGALAVRRTLAARLGRPMLGVGIAGLALLLPFWPAHGPAAYAGAVVGAFLGAAGLAALLFLAWRFLEHSLAFRRAAEELVDGLPNLGQALRFRAGARFLRALGPLLAAGLQVQRAAVLGARCTGSVFHGIRLLEAAGEIAQGTPVRDALGSRGILPYDVLAEVGRGEESGDLPERLAAASEGLAEFARAEMEAAVPTMARATVGLLAAMLALAVGATYLVAFW